MSGRAFFYKNTIFRRKCLIAARLFGFSDCEMAFFSPIGGNKTNTLKY